MEGNVQITNFLRGFLIRIFSLKNSVHSVVNFNKQEGENSIRLLICSSFESPTRPCNHDDRYGRHLRAIFQIPTSFLPELLAEEELAAKNEPISKGPLFKTSFMCCLCDSKEGAELKSKSIRWGTPYKNPPPSQMSASTCGC